MNVNGVRGMGSPGQNVRCMSFIRVPRRCRRVSTKRGRGAGRPQKKIIKRSRIHKKIIVRKITSEARGTTEKIQKTNEIDNETSLEECENLRMSTTEI